MSNFRFDSELVIKKMIEYFYIHGKEKCTSISMEKLYSEVVKYATSKNKKPGST